MTCKCKSDRIITIQAWARDCFSLWCGDYEYDGYFPDGLEQLGNGDAMEIDLCLDCGRIQNFEPVKEEVINKIFNIE